ncbi:MAG: efflux RND transporter periplasmic adaptor subunit [Hyphomicrobiales bacterium]|nr:efflux RND transporter periplasmic adaptor subunit [Hyphomicrobiales bacterium]
MKDLAIIRIRHRGSAKVVKSALLYFHSRARSACVFALSIAIWLFPRVGIASEAFEQKFDGVVVPRQWVQVVPQVNGVLSRILFVPGQHVSKGDVLFEMDADAFAIDVRIAQSELDEARARLSLAEDAAARQARLLRESATAQQLARQTEIQVEIERANVAHKEGSLAKAQLALSRTRVVSPLSGTIGRPHVAPGAFVEAARGMVLVEIAQLDPMLVYFQVPYVERQRALDRVGAFDADELFDNSTLSLELPTERIYELSGKPEPHGEEIDQTTDVMTVWAAFPNPHKILVPGLRVHVISRLADQIR